MSTPAENVITHTVADQHRPETVLRIIRDALSHEHSPINNTDHPWHTEAVKALRRLQLQLFDPSHPTVSELDIKRLTISSLRVERINDNIKFHGSAVGRAPTYAIDPHNPPCFDCGAQITECECDFDEDW